MVSIQMVVLTPLIRELKERFPGLFDLWEEDKLRALGFREGDIDVIHELFGRDLLYTGIIVLLAFTHGDCYPVSTIESTFNVSEDRVLKAFSELLARKVVYSEKFGHPISGWKFYYADRDLLLALVREHKLVSAKQKIRGVLQSEESLLVFVSSVMNKELENLDAERQMARVGIEDVGFTRAWLFEGVPASSEPLPDQFLKKIERSDFFILILGKNMTDIVELEYQTALKSGVRRLVFLKGGVERTRRTIQFIKTIDVKYKEFWNVNDLRAQVSASLTDEILRLARKSNQSTQTDKSEI